MRSTSIKILEIVGVWRTVRESSRKYDDRDPVDANVTCVASTCRIQRCEIHRPLKMSSELTNSQRPNILENGLVVSFHGASSNPSASTTNRLVEPPPSLSTMLLVPWLRRRDPRLSEVPVFRRIDRSLRLHVWSGLRLFSQRRQSSDMRTKPLVYWSIQVFQCVQGRPTFLRRRPEFGQ